jgi:hypothetical protein
MGGKFQDGFISAAVSAGAMDLGLVSGGTVSKAFKAGVIGGTASALGGGKFANGAFTAAFQFLTNEAAAMSREEAIAYFENSQGEKLSWLAKLFFKHETIANVAEAGANFAGGFSDGVLMGYGETLARAVHGEDYGWVNEDSGWYMGGVGTGIAASTVAGGALQAARAGGVGKVAFYELGQKWLPRMASRSGRLESWIARPVVERGEIVLRAAKGNWVKALLPDKIFAPMAPRALRTGPTPLAGGAVYSGITGFGNYINR